MVKYPISVRRNYYRGNDKRKRQKTSEANANAAEMERVINNILLQQTQPIRTYDWHEISRETGIPEDTVAALGYSIAGGSNGFTAYRHDLSMEKAIQMNEADLPTDDGAAFPPRRRTVNENSSIINTPKPAPSDEDAK